MRNYSYFNKAGELILAPNHQKWVAVPADQVTIFNLVIPGGKNSNWEKAVPYALEDKIGGNLGDTEFIIMDRDKSGRTIVAVCSKLNLSNWLKSLDEADMGDAELIPEFYLTPPSGLSNVWATYDLDDVTLFRESEWVGGGLPVGLVDPLSAQKNATVLSTDQLVLDGLDDSRFSLRQGFHSQPRKQSLVKTSVYTKLLIFSLTIFIGAGVSQYFFAHHIESKAAAYQGATEDLFKSLFPNTKRIVNIKVQTQNNLDQAAATQTGLIGHVEAAKQALISSGLDFNTDFLTWDSGKLSIGIELKNGKRIQSPQSLFKLPDGFNAEFELDNNVQNRGVLHVSVVRD